MYSFWYIFTNPSLICKQWAVHMLVSSKRLNAVAQWLFCLWKQSDMSTSGSVAWVLGLCYLFFKHRQIESVWEICFGNFVWKSLFFQSLTRNWFSAVLPFPGEHLCLYATCSLCYIHIIYSQCLLLCSQLLEGSFTSQVSHEVDGLIFQPIGVSLTQTQTARREAHSDCRCKVWANWGWM